MDTTNTANILIGNNLVKNFNKRTIVDNVSIKVPQGKIIGLLGPNGAGKTSCFYMILGLIKCDAGKIYLNQQEITYWPIHKRAQAGIGYLPQESSIFRKLSVADNILGILEITATDKDIISIEERLENLLIEFKLTHVREVKGISLSGGERRRLEIARTLAINPKFILLDEPFAGIDPISIYEIKKILRKLTQYNIGILITEHNVRDTLNIYDQAYVMNNGKVIATGKMNELINNSEVKEVYLGKEFML